MNTEKNEWITGAQIFVRLLRKGAGSGIPGYVLCIIFFSLTSVHADMWTNAVGHGIEAQLVSLKKDTVTLQRTKSKPFKMKLSAFCATDQKRIRKYFGLKEVPEKPTATDLAFEKKLSHLIELHVAGKMDDDEFDKQQAVLLKHFYGPKAK